MIINLFMKSHTFHTLRTLPLFVLAAAVTLAVPPLARDKQAPAARPAAEYPASDSHPAEHVTIAIDPCTEPGSCDFFRLPYIRHSFIPVRVIITNDSDTALDLDEARMQFISASRDKLPAASLDDINRRLFSTKQAAGTRVPIIPIPIHHAPVDKKITQDDEDFGFKTTTVTPHTTVAGYLFYDIQRSRRPAAQGLRDLHQDDPHRQGKRALRLLPPVQQVAGLAEVRLEARVSGTEAGSERPALTL